MIEKLIELSAKSRFMVLLFVAMISAWGVWAVFQTPLDAVPDLAEWMSIQPRTEMLTTGIRSNLDIKASGSDLQEIERAGADVMKHIAAPMVGGMVTSTILTLCVIPAIYAVWRNRQICR